MVMKMLKTFTAIIDRQKDIERLQEMKDYIDARIRALGPSEQMTGKNLQEEK